jgi:hypothetical protein
MFFRKLCFSKTHGCFMEITGHSRESTFLSYIGENPNKDAVADVFMERLRRLGNESG